MTNDALKAAEIRKGWVTNYPNPKFSGDKIECLVSIEAAHKDISFLFTLIDADREKIEQLEGELYWWLDSIRKVLDFLRVNQKKKAVRMIEIRQNSTRQALGEEE